MTKGKLLSLLSGLEEREKSSVLTKNEPLAKACKEYNPIIKEKLKFLKDKDKLIGISSIDSLEECIKANNFNDIETVFKTIIVDLDTWICRYRKERADAIKAYLEKHKNKIDGETTSVIVMLVSTVLQIVSAIIILLLSLQVIPNSLGVWDLGDTFYFILGAGFNVITLLTLFIIKLINIHNRKRSFKYDGYEFEFEELLLAKYSNCDNLSKFNRLVLRININRQINIFGNNVSNCYYREPNDDDN